MAGKSPVKTGAVAGKQPSNLKKLKNRNVGGKSAPVLSNMGLLARPRRFSLIYSSDSSLSALSDLEGNRKTSFKNPKMSKKSKRGVSNEMGKNGKLIPENAVDSDSDSSSDVGAIDEESDNQDSSSDDDNEEDDDDDDEGAGKSGNGDSSSASSSDDDDVDFVKLSAERKKRAMRAMSAIKRGKSPKKSDVSHKYNSKDGKAGKNIKVESLGKDKPKVESSDEDALAFTFKNDGGIKFGDETKDTASDEDLGEEINDGRNSSTKTPASKTAAVDRLNVPQISESEESDYEIDHDAYLKSIQHDEEDIVGLDNGLDTGEDDVPMLDEEENHIVMELENDDELSFNGSIHEEGEDPVEIEAQNGKSAKFSSQTYKDYDDEDEDEIMSDFDEPFYEDPKFANLYYCAGSDQPLSLSTSLPLILDDEKRRNLDKKQTKKMEREELIRRRKLSRKLDKERRQKSAATDLDNEEYLFGVYFRSDGEEEKIHSLESPLRQLGSAAASETDYSSDEEYENILLDIAHMPTDEESLGVSAGGLDHDDDEDDDDDDDDDDVSMSNVFIDIDDLDPDSFYFQYESSDGEDLNENSKGLERSDLGKLGEPEDKDYVETVVYIDGESTDEDETLPPPDTRNKIGSKAKEVVSANVVGLKPPKLGTWETDNKPFSIIDGLSTKSLYPLAQDQQLLEQQQLQQQPLSASELSGAGEKEELTLNELLNMSELDDEDGTSNANNNNGAASEWYNKPKVPLSAFRNKGVDVTQDEEYMLPVFSARKCPIGYVGSERTRRKIDRMKELQKKKSEERRKVKKKKKLLKLKRERDRLEKESLTEATAPIEAENEEGLGAVIQTDSLSASDKKPDYDAIGDANSSKNSIESMDLDDINNLLSHADSDLVAHEGHDMDIIGTEDADILATLTAPVNVDTIDHKNMTTGAAWRRRQSVVEAAAENLRFTKSGLFSESALADLEQIIGGSAGSVIEFSDVLQ
ncbi:LANO_0E11276g1_1 [Lachancea nothofagi CBS 11611]|uniref:LANO_0E11276g1_1 n=1 Tax=Lachancea nothofagi CBS 11611 TaxID=1266666 RepID=A0A1G4JXF6_9SACH|nr:LANO_0E11276g1_1 [Lachancea nothofagi CBS 11611]